VPSHALPPARRDPSEQRPVGYEVTVGRIPEHIRAAQVLRHQTFSGEFGTITPGPVGLDADRFDEICDHIVVWFTSSDPGPSEAVATYRLLPPARSDFGCYADFEFDLAAVRPLLPYTVESGRSCVRADHRNAATTALLWSAIAQYMMRGGFRYLMGCTSIALADGGETAAGVWSEIQNRYRDPLRECLPRRPWPGVPAPPAPVRFPSLMMGYLRLGATVLGPPAIDAMFHCADFLVLLDLQNSDQRYLRRFLPAMAATAGDEQLDFGRGDRR
jgi:putative hemolysin